MRINNLNSYLLVLILYKDPISLLLSSYFSPLQIKTAFFITMIFAVLIINKFKVNSKFIIFYLIITSLLLLNVLLVEYKQFVIPDAINVLLILFVPLYVFTIGKYAFISFRNAWYKIAVGFTFLLPLYYFYLQFGYINYMDFGYLTHINSMIFTYYYFKSSKNKGILLLLILINTFTGLFFGSRMIFAATIIVFIFAIYILQAKTFKNILRTSLITVMIIFLSLNIVNILELLMSVVQAKGISSRNIALFHSYLTGDLRDGLYLSGREGIYPIINEFLQNNGVFPSGLSVARYLTNGIYYHAHSFYLEFPLVFGFILSIIILMYFLYKGIIFYKIKDNIGFSLMALILISFLSRSVT